jgi:general secretion pathway protein H
MALPGTFRLAPDLDRGRGGFTLIELLLVIVVVGMLVGFGAVNLDGITQSSRLKASARRLASTIRLGQDQSIVSGIYHSIEFDMNLHRYRLLQFPEWATPDQDVADDDLQFLSWNNLEHGVRFEDITEDDGDVIEDPPTGSTYRVGFDIAGPRYGYVLHLIDQRGERFSLEINGLTGLVNFYDYYREIDQVTEDDFDFN